MLFNGVENKQIIRIIKVFRQQLFTSSIFKNATMMTVNCKGLVDFKIVITSGNQNILIVRKYETNLLVLGIIRVILRI